MIRGENIGTAYVRIIADGTGLDRSIRDEMEDVDWDSMGRKGSQEFQKGWADEQQKAPGFNRLRDSVVEPLIRGKWLSEEFFGSKNWTTFRNDLHEHFGEEGDRAGENLERRMFEGMDFDGLSRVLDNLTPELVKATKDLDRERLKVERDMLDEAFSMNKQFNDDVLKDRLDADKKWDLHLQAGRQAEQQWLDTLNDAYKLNAERNRQVSLQVQKSTKDFRSLTFEIERMEKGMRTEGGRDRGELINDLYALRGNMDRLGTSTVETNARFEDYDRRLALMHPTLNKFRRATDGLAASVGKSFGKGSRNDFINFIGSVAGGTARLLNVLPNLWEGISNVGRRAALAGRQGGPLSAMRSVLLDLGGVALKVGAGFAGAFAFVGPLLSLLSQLAGVVIALAGNMSFALVGALGALGGSLLPVAAAVGGLILGFKSLDGEAAKAAKGVVNEFKGLGDAVAEGLTMNREGIDEGHHHVVHSFEQMMGTIRGMVSRLDPLMTKVGRGMSDAIDIFIDRISGAQGPWDKFIKSMQGDEGTLGWLGSRARNVGRIVTESFGGLLGMFRALQPITTSFLQWLRDLTVRFNDWINKASGQNAVKRFMEDAKESVIDLGDFLGSTWDLLRTFLDAGKDTGDSFFASMSDTIDEWVTKLRNNPEILRNFFSDVEHFGNVLGGLLTSVGHLFDALDNEFSRGFSTGALELVAGIIGGLANALRTVADILGISEGKFLSFAGQASAAALVLPMFGNKLSAIGDRTTGLVGKLRTAETRMVALKGAAGGLAGAAGIGLLIGSTKVANDKLSVMMTTLGGAATGFAVGGPIGAAVGGLAGLIGGLATKTGKGAGSARRMYDELAKINPVEVATDSLADLAGTLDQVTGAYTGATRAAVLKKLEDTDMIEAAGRYGISARTVVNAALGQKGALEALAPAVGRAESAIQKLTTKEEDLVAQRDALIDSASINDSDRQVIARTEEIAKIDESLVALRKDKNARLANLEVLKKMPGELRKQGREIRNNAAATADYSGLLHGIPQDIRSKINVDGIKPSVTGVAKVAEKYDLVDRKEIKTLIEASGADATVKEVLKVIEKNKELDNQKPNPKLGLTKDQFDNAWDASMDALRDINVFTANPRIDVLSNANDVAAEANRALGQIYDETVNVVYKRVGGGRDLVTATGGLFNYAQRRIIGEAGPEAVVPLNRPLGQVDPAVRWLSAIAQGKTPRMARGGVTGAGRTYNIEQTIVSPQSDPRAVATEAINRLVASAY